MAAYSPLNTSESNINFGNDEMSTMESNLSQQQTLSRVPAIPISRTPTNPRDLSYWSLFMMSLIICSVMGFIKHSAFLQDSFVLYRKAGGWSSMLMVSTLFGCIIGTALTLSLTYNPMKDFLLKYAMKFSIFMQIAISFFTIIILGTQCWPITIIILFGVYCDTRKYILFKESSAFVGAQIETSVHILGEYSISYILSVTLISALQTGLLLWLGVIFVGLLTEVHAGLAAILIIFMSITFYWTIQLFQAIISSITGACVLWYFIKNDTESLEPSKRVGLYTQTAFSASLGTLCKAALLIPLTQSILAIDFWASTPSIGIDGLMRKTASFITHNMAIRCHQYSRLIYPIIGTYSQTFNRAARHSNDEEHISVILDATANFFLKGLASGASLLVLFAFAAVGHHDPSLPLFLCISLFLVHSGTSLLLTCIRSAIDTLTIAFSLNPSRLALLSPVVFHRYLRTIKDK